MKQQPPLTDWREWLIGEFRKHPEDAVEYLKVSFEEYQKDGDAQSLLLALRTVAEVQGGIPTLARKTKMNRQSLYKALSADGNPRLDTIGAILGGLGYRLSLVPLKQ